MEEATINTLNNEMLVGGESVNKFEDEFAHFIGTDYAAAPGYLYEHSIHLESNQGESLSPVTFVATVNGSFGRIFFVKLGMTI
jgi:dTDP-4-amino-4,6-dideoxygalactose transaminase